MPPSYAREFTPELSSGYLASILNPIQEQEIENVALARKEGQAAGLVGQAATGSRIGMAEADAGTKENAAIERFNLDVAEKKYGERMTDEERAFRDMERQKTEAFQTEMAKMGYDFEASQNQGAENAAMKGELVGGLFGLAGSGSKAAGSYLGGLPSAAAKPGAAAGYTPTPGATEDEFDPMAGYKNTFAGEGF